MWLTYGIDYWACNCRVWPIVRLHGFGRCGACRKRPDELIGHYEDMNREEATRVWKIDRH